MVPTTFEALCFHVASPDLAEGLTAETFFKLVRAAERFDTGKGTPRTWIFSIARNVLADHRRRAPVRPYVPIGNLRDLVCDAPSAEERLLREEDVARLLNGSPLFRLPTGSSSGFGPADDALIIVGRPPDRVTMAAIYDRAEERPQYRLN